MEKNVSEQCPVIKITGTRDAKGKLLLLQCQEVTNFQNQFF
jgi:hypothetical protein